MTLRQQIQIPVDLINQIDKVVALRPDLEGYTVSKKVHLLLQEAIKENLRNATKGQAHSAPIVYSEMIPPLQLTT
tara:strand:- start:287 stop:511 length:225 start_codon:yes stop_codon:yes gene_type:complete